MTRSSGPIPALELCGVVKRFGDVLAVDHADLEVAAGEVRALVGENGAGKTTLMRIAYGMLEPDAGEIRIDGVRRRLSSALDAIEAGLGMVHQHFMLFPDLTVTENVVLGAEPRRLGVLETGKAARRVSDLARKHGFGVDAHDTVRDLSVGERQEVEILKALYRDARILILDEPTAVLGPRERDSLFAVIEELASLGTAVVLITHKLREVGRLADRATVMRDGAVVGTVDVGESDSDEIARMMTGRDLEPPPVRERRSAGKIGLLLSELSVEDPSGRVVVDRVSLEVDCGEIVGIAGAAGNGQSELVEAIAGLRPVARGSVRIGETSAQKLSVGERRRLGLAWLPDDRDGTGSSLAGSVVDNLIMGSESSTELAASGLFGRDSRAVFAADRIRQYGIKCADPMQPMLDLSGGNRQKAVIARELPIAGTVLLAEQPTRGVDFAASAQVHERLLECRARGGAVLLVSSDLAELMALSDRIVVMFEGHVVGELSSAEATEQRLGLLMAGSMAEATGE